MRGLLCSMYFLYISFALHQNCQGKLPKIRVRCTLPRCTQQQCTRASDGRAVGFTDVPENATCAASYDLPPSTGGMAMVCMIDEPIGDVRSEQSRIIGIFRKVSSVKPSLQKLTHALEITCKQRLNPHSATTSKINICDGVLTISPFQHFLPCC